MMIVESVNPTSFVIPKATKTVRDVMKAEKGTLIYNTSDNIVYVATSANVGSSYWKPL